MNDHEYLADLRRRLEEMARDVEAVRYLVSTGAPALLREAARALGQRPAPAAIDPEAAERLRKIVRDAKGDDLERIERHPDRPWLSDIHAVYRRERAAWQAAHDLLESLLAPHASPGAAGGGEP